MAIDTIVIYSLYISISAKATYISGVFCKSELNGLVVLPLDDYKIS